MSCFVCDSVTPETHKILEETPLCNVLYDFISKSFDVQIDDAEIVCDACKTILDALDHFRRELIALEQMLQLQITRKYKLNEPQVYRLDDQSARRYRKGESLRFACVECSFETDFVDCLSPHNWIHEHQGRFVKSSSSVLDSTSDCETNVCHRCHVSFSTNELLELHSLEFHNVDETQSKPFASIKIETDSEINDDDDDDDETTINPESIAETREMNEDEEYEELECDRCMGKFECRRDLQQHLRSVHSFCTICNTKCRNQTTLQGHILRKHTKHVCDKCGKVLGSLSSHRAHQATHGLHLKFTCPYCQKGFLAKSLLDHHIVIHTKESNFQCHVCGQNFVHQRALRLHIQWHTNPRPYKCPFCEKTYKHISHLAVHKRAVHLGELPNACQVCEKRFATASKLKVHMVKHTGVYSHPCKLCSRGYMKRYKLAEHMANAHGDNTMLVNKPKCEYKLVIRPTWTQSQSNNLNQ